MAKRSTADRRTVTSHREWPYPLRSRAHKSPKDEPQSNEDTVPEKLEQPKEESGKGLGYIRFTIADGTLTTQKASELLTKLQTLKPIVADGSSLSVSEGTTPPTATIQARTCCTVTVAISDQMHAVIIGKFPGCTVTITNRDLGGPPLKPAA